MDLVSGELLTPHNALSDVGSRAGRLLTGVSISVSEHKLDDPGASHSPSMQRSEPDALAKAFARAAGAALVREALKTGYKRCAPLAPATNYTFRKNGNALYKGLTARSIDARVREHALDDRPFVAEADALDWTCASSRQEGRKVEKAGIAAECPKHNKADVPPTCAVDWMIREMGLEDL
jgi:hypothetical protein